MLIAAHGNSLRALVKYLENMSEQDIVELNIPTGVPLVYVLDDELQPLQKYYLGDQEAAMRKAAAVANQARRTELSRQPAAMDCDRLSAIELVLAVIDGFLRRLFAADPQRSEEPAVVGRQIKASRAGSRRAGVVIRVTAVPLFLFTNPTTASSVTRMSNPASRALARQAST